MTKSPKFIQPRISTEGLASTKAEQLRSNLRELGELAVRAEEIGLGKAVEERVTIPTLTMKNFSAAQNEELNKYFRKELVKALDQAGGETEVTPIAAAVIAGVASGVSSGVAGGVASSIVSKKVSSGETEN